MEVHVIMSGRGATRRVITATSDREAAERIASENCPASIITLSEAVLELLPKDDRQNMLNEEGDGND